jgi:hypothetical protein
MRTYKYRLAAAMLAAAILSAPAALPAGETIDITNHLPHEQLQAQIARYAPVDISYDESVLSEPEKQALAKLVQAADVMDEIFLRQVWEGNVELRKNLVYAMGSDADK